MWWQRGTVSCCTRKELREAAGPGLPLGRASCYKGVTEGVTFLEIDFWRRRRVGSGVEGIWRGGMAAIAPEGSAAGDCVTDDGALYTREPSIALSIAIRFGEHARCVEQQQQQSSGAVQEGPTKKPRKGKN